MGELIALTRLNLSHSRVTVTLGASYFLLIHIATLVYASLGLESSAMFAKSVSVWLALASLPLVGITLAMFDFSDRHDLDTGATGYLGWLLRMPIATWKLAIVPILLKTVWIGLAIAGVALTSALVGAPLKGWLIPTFGISALAVLACFVAWQPFRGNRTRLILCFALLAPCYLWFVGSVSTAFLPIEETVVAEWGRLAEPAVWLIALGSYSVVVLLAIRAVGSARYNTNGRPVESSGWIAGAGAGANSASESADHAQPWPLRSTPRVTRTAALVRFDLAKLRGFGFPAIIVTWLSAIALWGSFSSVSLVPVIIMVVILAYPAMILSDWINQSRDTKFIPSLISSAPISTARIVWTRQAVCVLLWLSGYCCVPVVWFIWTLTGANVTLARQWNEAMALRFDSPTAGVSVALALGLACVLVIVRQATWTVAMAATDQRRCGLYSMVAKLFIMFAIFNWWLFHFLKFPDWEAWSEWSWQQLESLPVILLWLLGVKAAIVLTSTMALVRSRLVSGASIAKIFGVYFLLTLAGSALFCHWLPSTHVAVWHCAAATALVMPLSRVLIAPVCLASSRHRR